MSELPISKKYYNQTMLISELICALKNERDNQSITDVHFSPVTKGYDVSFIKDTKQIRLLIRCRKLFNGCVVKMFTDGSKSEKFVLKTKSDIDYCINKIKK